jgi:hypothetical protein
MTYPSIDQLITAAEEIIALHGPAAQAVKSKLETTRAKITSKPDITRDGVVGPLYELFRVEKILKKKHTLLDSSGIADTYYSKPTKGSRGAQHKWVTSAHINKVRQRGSDAIKQLVGGMEGNDEMVPVDELRIADVVTEKSQDAQQIKKTLDMLAKFAKSKDGNFRISITSVLDASNGSSTKYIADVTGGGDISFRVADGVTKERAEIFKAIHYADLIAGDCNTYGYAAIKKDLASQISAL